MDVKGEGYNRIQRPNLASVAVGHAMLHYMHNELVICQDNKISSFMLMLKVMKTQIEVTQLTLITRYGFTVVEICGKNRVCQLPFRHSLKTAPLEKPDALNTEDNAAPCRR
ncbi:hypothetical protein T4B_5285 [Trichinella pseudospiralis]|uniref:Uncharacterized protein n=1 Tax=Trichinella pseudospiralis TaxID=6337 RepID=A0A0V1K064_TRIPS|nr:hypothetical protein T4B_5285 [Trichinella pseudospiralis]KRZ40534.1 hypothetical protein T4C_10873 [Trichinella pseudospiralis]